MDEGLLSLKWNNHQSTFFQVLAALRQKLTFTDVTVACEGRMYPAHKFVLSACSEYFSEVFGSVTGTNLVVVLKDVRRADLEYLLDYMYLGQVDVAQSELASLIKTAECLRIKGLAIPDDEPQKSRTRVPEDHREGSPPAKRKRHHVDEDRGSSSLSGPSNASALSSRIQQDTIAPPSDINSVVQQMRQSEPHTPQTTTPQTTVPQSSKPQPVPLPLPQVPITSQGSTSSPTVPAPPIPEIKQEVTDPAESPDVFEGYEDGDTKPDVSDGAVPGPSGLQRPSDGWDGDGDMGSFSGGGGGGEGFSSETGMEEQGDGEVQGGPGHQRLPSGLHLLQAKSQRKADHRLHSSFRRRVSPDADSTDRQKGSKSDSHVKTSSQVENSLIVGCHLDESTMNQDIPALYKTLQAEEAFAQAIFKNVNLNEHPNPTQDLQVSLDGQLFQDPSSHRLPPNSLPIESLTGQESSMLDSQQEAVGVFEAGGQLNKYVCQWCGRNFDRISNLKRHALLHSGIKPFKCLYCNYRATQKANVVQHLASRHREEMRALLQNNINVNDILVPAGVAKR